MAKGKKNTVEYLRLERIYYTLNHQLRSIILPTETGQADDIHTLS